MIKIFHNAHLLINVFHLMLLTINVFICEDLYHPQRWVYNIYFIKTEEGFWNFICKM